MSKWGRTFAIQIQTVTGGMITIQSPLTLDFNVSRRISGSCNTGTFRILNLSQATRSQIYKPWHNNKNIRKIEVQAGYGSALQTIFKGNVIECVSYRPEGSVNVITDISGQDGEWASKNTYSNLPVGAGVTQQEALRMMASDLEKQGIKIGQISSLFNEIFKKGRSFGPPLTTLQHIRNETKGNFWIDLETLFCLTDNEYAGTDSVVISSQTGLLGSPKTDGNVVTCEVLFEPAFKVGQQAILSSLVNPQLNEIYRVQGFTHSGTISGAVGGKLKTTVDLWEGKTLENIGAMVL